MLHQKASLPIEIRVPREWGLRLNPRVGLSLRSNIKKNRPHDNPIEKPVALFCFARVILPVALRKFISFCYLFSVSSW